MRTRREGGQGLVEFATVVPVFLIILLGILEFGFIFDQTMTISYATREGARSGSALAAGNETSMPCEDVDKQIIAAVQRVLEARGSDVDIANISQVRIFKATATGGDSGEGNNWSPGSGPVVDGLALKFAPDGGTGYNACTRRNVYPPDSIGISIAYRYDIRTPLAGILRFVGGTGAGSYEITDKTVMALNPTEQ